MKSAPAETAAETEGSLSPAAPVVANPTEPDLPSIPGYAQRTRPCCQEELNCRRSFSLYQIAQFHVKQNPEDYAKYQGKTQNETAVLAENRGILAIWQG